MRPAARRTNSQGFLSPGFTLVEIAVTVTILALGTTLVAVYLDAMLPQSKLQAAARSLGSVVADIRSSAITQGYSYQVEYDLDKDRYQVVTPFRAGGGIAFRPEDRIRFEWQYLPETVKLQSITIGNGESVERGLVVVEFDALGSSIEHDVHLHRDNPESDFTLHIDGLTGLVRFVSGKPVPNKADDSEF